MITLSNWHLFAALAVVSLLFDGCGYTMLDTRNSGRRKVKQDNILLPDLVITDIAESVQHVEMPRMHGFVMYRWMKSFDVKICNAGPGTFSGLLMVRYADNERDMNRSAFPQHSEMRAELLQPGDTTLFSLWDTGKPGTRVRFIVMTDSNPERIHDPVDPYLYFGLDKVPEESYENNIANYILR